MGVEEDEAASYPAAKGEEGGRVVRRLAKECVSDVSVVVSSSSLDCEHEKGRRGWCGDGG